RGDALRQRSRTRGRARRVQPAGRREWSAGQSALRRPAAGLADQRGLSTDLQKQRCAKERGVVHRFRAVRMRGTLPEAPISNRQVAQASCLWSRAGILPAGAGRKPALPDRRDACPTGRSMEKSKEEVVVREPKQRKHAKETI